MVALRGFAHYVPEVTDILSALPRSQERVENDRHCAFPACEVGRIPLYKKLNKCGRCKTAYYCCKSHQHDHWPEHRKCCAPAAPVPDQAQTTST
jgi:hypothetical protein